MVTIITSINNSIDSLREIQDIFKSNPELGRLIIKYYAAEDGGDVNTYIVELTINNALYEIRDDSQYFYMRDINDGIIPSEQLDVLEDNLMNLLSFSSDVDETTITIERNEILKLELKNI